VEILNDKPFVRLTSLRALDPRRLIAGGLAKLIPTAAAQPVESNPLMTQEWLWQTYASLKGVSVQSVSPQSPLTSAAGGLTYVQRIKLITAIEGHFHLKIPDNEWQPLQTLEELSKYLEGQQR
jgi:acyl carrier protein